MLRGLISKVKSVACKAKTLLVTGLAVGVSFLGTASAADDVKTAMEAVKTDAVTNVGIMLPIAIGILGAIFGAILTMAIFKKLTGRAS